MTLSQTPSPSKGVVRDLLGYLREIRRYDKDRLDYIEERRKLHGPNFYMHDTELVVTDGEVGKRLLADTYRRTFVTSGPYQPSSRELEAMRANEAAWKPARRALYHGIQSTDQKLLAQDSSLILSNYLASLLGRRIALPERLQSVSGAIASNLMLGERDGLRELVCTLGALNLALTDRSFMMPSWLPSRTARNQRRLSQMLTAKLQDVVHGRRSSPDAGQDGLVQSLAGHSELRTDQIVSAVRVTLLASFGVPGLATAWAILALKRDPRLEKAARSEADSVEVTESLVEEAPLLTAVVHEALRLYPPAWLLNRSATEHCEIHGLSIQPGTSLNIVIYSIQRDERWQYPTLFLPERWMRPDAYRRGVFMPFGWGPGMCAGSRIGVLQVVAMLHAFLRTYDLTQIRLDDRPTIRGLLTPTRFEGRLVARGVQ